jgi:hypothetical protein
MGGSALLDVLALATAVLALAAVAALGLVVLTVRRLGRLEQRLRQDLEDIRAEVMRAIRQVHETSSLVSKTVDRYGTGAQYVGWAVQAVNGLRQQRAPEASGPGVGRWVRTALGLGWLLWRAANPEQPARPGEVPGNQSRPGPNP